MKIQLFPSHEMTNAQRPLGRNGKEMVLHFCSLIWSLKKGKVLASIWGAGLIACFLAALSKYKRQQRERRIKLKQPKDKKVSVYQKSLLTLLKPLLAISFPKLSSKPTFHLICYTILLCARILLTIKIAKITGSLGKVSFY